MPITLPCSSCSKRFRVRDESAGKRVKCPFCQAIVDVPTAEVEPQATPAPALPASVPAPPPPPMEPPPPAPVKPADWGSNELVAPPKIFLEDAPPPRPPVSLPPVDRKPQVNPPPAAKKSPEQIEAGGWRKARSGLGWVRFALCWVALVGLVPVGKMAYARWVEPLPEGEGQVKIAGYINSGPDTITLDRRDELDLLLYGVPAILGGLALVFGRLTAGAVPRSSGAKGMFALSGLATLLALAGLATWVVCLRLAAPDISRYAVAAMAIGGGLAELWFLLGLATAGGALQYPRASRAVGFFVLLLGLGVLVSTIGWDEYLKHGGELGVPKPKNADWHLYEEGAKALGGLVLVWGYWRAVGAVRRAIREYLPRVEASV